MRGNTILTLTLSLAFIAGCSVRTEYVASEKPIDPMKLSYANMGVTLA